MSPYGGSDREDSYESRGPRGTRVYVGGLSDVVKKDDLQTEFEKFGKLNSVWVAFNPPGFAFVEFASRNDAEAACDSMNDFDLMGSKLRVEISRGRGRGRGGGGRGGGGRGRGDFRDSRGGGGFRSGGRGGFRGGRDSFGSSRGGRGGSRYDDYEDRRSSGGGGFRGGRDSRDSYGGGSRSYGSSGGGGGYRGGKDSRFRSRSPVSRGSSGRDAYGGGNSYGGDSGFGRSSSYSRSGYGGAPY